MINLFFLLVREDGGFINFKESQPVKLKFNNHELKEFQL